MAAWEAGSRSSTLAHGQVVGAFPRQTGFPDCSSYQSQVDELRVAFVLALAAVALREPYAGVPDVSPQALRMWYLP
jgi:hypothetical protein